MQIILTEGKGPGSLYVPEKVKDKDSEGLFPAGSGYEVINISEKRAILETSENMPLSLAVRYDDNITITIETSALNKSEIVKFAESLLALM